MTSNCQKFMMAERISSRIMERELVDSEEGKTHIKANWKRLLHCTEVNTTVLTSLFAEDIITREENDGLVSFSNKNKLQAAGYLYDLIVTRRHGYAAVANALFEANQTHAYEILALMLPLCKIRKHSSALANQTGTSMCAENQTVQSYTALDIGYGNQDNGIYSTTENTPIVGSINAELKVMACYCFGRDWKRTKYFLVFILILIAIVCCLGFLIKPRYMINHFLLIKLIFVLILITLVCIGCLHAADIK